MCKKILLILVASLCLFSGCEEKTTRQGNISVTNNDIVDIIIFGTSDDSGKVLEGVDKECTIYKTRDNRCYLKEELTTYDKNGNIVKEENHPLIQVDNVATSKMRKKYTYGLEWIQGDVQWEYLASLSVFALSKDGILSTVKNSNYKIPNINIKNVKQFLVADDWFDGYACEEDIRKIKGVIKDCLYVLFENGDVYSYSLTVNGKEKNFNREKVFENITEIEQYDLGEAVLALDKNGKVSFVTRDDRYIEKKGVGCALDELKGYVDQLTDLNSIRGYGTGNFFLYNNGDLYSAMTWLAQGDTDYDTVSRWSGRKVKNSDKQRFGKVDVPTPIVKAFSNNDMNAEGDYALVICSDNSVWAFRNPEDNYTLEKIIMANPTEVSEDDFSPFKTILQGDEVKRVRIENEIVYVYNTDGTITIWTEKDTTKHKLTLDYLTENSGISIVD